LRAEPGLSTRVSLERLRDAGLRPATVFDVGVAAGTPELYGIFPDVRYALVEPLEESRPFMEAFVRDNPGSVAVHAAAGRRAGEAALVVSSNLSGSSFIMKPKHGSPRTVPMVALDDVAEAHHLPAPYLLKLDTQGYELEALAGAERMLADTCALVAEVSMWGDRKGIDMTEFAPLVAWLRERGFVLYDIAAIIRRDFDGAVTEMDLVFLPAASALRANHRYKATSEDEAMIQVRLRDFGGV
jgi:FkbM family methyltransferase